ncbi:MAG: sulfotransferase domain-containing protein [Acaryochloridaceae cyanobacterium RU_4_10]|nr:sulfotransferase domain-containing protein [Acaryochloridaceae cyanobacterium RU_4_10]
MKPNFLFIGPDKTGSSWMYEILRQHPHCFVPLCKDIYFFDRDYERGLDWYFGLFQGATPSHLAIGELSHDYLFSVTAAERIYKDLPEVKLITCLRHPVERTFSHYLFMVRSGRTQDSFESALQNYPEIIHNSLYHHHLKEYFQRFPKEQIKVLFFKNLQKAPIQFVKELFEFIHIPFVPDLDYEKKILPAARPRNFAIARLAKLSATMARDLGLVTMVGVIKRSAIVRFLYEPLPAQDRPIVAEETIIDLLMTFKEDTLLLQDLLQTDLSDWLTFKQ